MKSFWLGRAGIDWPIGPAWRADPVDLPDSHRLFYAYLRDGGDEGWDTAIEVAQPYAIVVVRYTPQDYRVAVLGVDAVDIGEDSQPLLVDSSVEVTYAANDPRTVRLPNRTREHHLRNPLEWIKQQLFALGLGAALILLVNWIGNRWQRLLDKRHAAALSRNVRVSYPSLKALGFKGKSLELFEGRAPYCATRISRRVNSRGSHGMRRKSTHAAL